MKKLLTGILAVSILASCSSKKGVHYQNKQIEKAANKQTSGNYTNYTVASYIQRFKGICITEMNNFGIPASITMAQAILESGTGNSDLARYANNHFGIKCTSDWTGKGYYKDDDKKDDCFRVYKNPEESFKDHSAFLKRKRYAFLFELDKNDYAGWAKGLKQAGYATNPKYPDLLIGLIERYDLHQYDLPEGKYEKIKREDKVLSDINKNIPNEAKKDTEKDSAPIIAGDNYIVQQGDTLYNISKRFGLTVDELKALNNMDDNTIKIGQGLRVKK
nr:glucosaminidase domain-containing protein [uncultured Pedobacter sp.]